MSKQDKLGCSHPKVVRRSRNGLIDAIMYRFGRYPWVCRMCGCRVYYKDRRPGGEHGSVRADGFGPASGQSMQTAPKTVPAADHPSA